VLQICDVCMININLTYLNSLGDVEGHGWPLQAILQVCDLCTISINLIYLNPLGDIEVHVGGLSEPCYEYMTYV
jgi:hypothetical protein